MDRRAILAVAIWLSTSACFPFPIAHQRLPKAEGRLVEDGRPLANVDVAYVWGRGDCAEPVQTTVTDADGRFRFPGDRAPVAMVSMFPLPPKGWHVCFDEGAYWYGEWTTTVSPKEVELRCDARARPVCLVERRD